MARASRAYLDWNATTPPLPSVLDAMRDAGEVAWGNPSSVHADGRAARAILEDARARVAALTGVDPRDIVFTGGGTEANNLALRSLATPGKTIVTSRIEHPSITRVAEALEAERARQTAVRWLDITPAGTIDLDDLDRALAGDVSVVTVQAVNHETGIVQPVAEVIARAHAKGVRVHVDAIQGWGKLDVPGGWDTASVAPHKMRGPKGIGALASREGIVIDPVLVGGSQERGRRPGTASASLAAGFGAAAAAVGDGPSRWARLGVLRDRLEQALLALDTIHGRARIAGDPALRAPHVSNLLWPGWLGAELVAALDLEGLSVSSGAACSAGTIEPSPVLAAMGLGDDAARGVRMSIGDATTTADVDAAIRAFRAVLAR